MAQPASRSGLWDAHIGFARLQQSAASSAEFRGGCPPHFSYPLLLWGGSPTPQPHLVPRFCWLRTIDSEGCPLACRGAGRSFGVSRETLPNRCWLLLTGSRIESVRAV